MRSLTRLPIIGISFCPKCELLTNSIDFYFICNQLFCPFKFIRKLHRDFQFFLTFHCFHLKILFGLFKSFLKDHQPNRFNRSWAWLVPNEYLITTIFKKEEDLLLYPTFVYWNRCIYSKISLGTSLAFEFHVLEITCLSGCPQAILTRISSWHSRVIALTSLRWPRRFRISVIICYVMLGSQPYWIRHLKLRLCGYIFE